MTFIIFFGICVLLFVLFHGLGRIRTVYVDFEYIEIPEHIQTEVLKHCDCALGEEHGPHCKGAAIASHWVDTQRYRKETYG